MKINGRSILRLGLKLVVWFVVALVVGELFCRMTGLGSWVVYKRGLYRAAADPALATEFTPGFNGRSYGTKVRINRLGFRGDDVPDAPAKDTFRIVCVGDSFTFGMGVEQADAWPAALERMLAPPAGYARVEVINAGVPGYNLRQETAAIRAKVLPLSPHLVVLGLVCNDLEPAFEVRDGYLCVPRKVHSLRIPGKRWFQTHSYFYQFMSMKYSQAVARAVGESRMQTPTAPALLRQTETAAEDGLRELRTLTGEMGAKGITALVANLDIPTNSPLASIGRNAGASVCSVPLDPREAIPDGHPDKRGHARIAAGIADVLEGKAPPTGAPLPAGLRFGRK